MKTKKNGRKLAKWNFLDIDLKEKQAIDHSELLRRSEYCRTVQAPAKSREELKLRLSELAVRHGDRHPPSLMTIGRWRHQLAASIEPLAPGQKAHSVEDERHSNHFVGG